MPDIDVDFCFERRGEVIEYVRAEVRQGLGRPDRHLRDDEVARRRQGRGRACSGFTPGETDALAKLIPNAPNFSLTVDGGDREGPRASRRCYEQRRALPAAARLRRRARRPVAPHRRARGRRRHRAGSARRLRARSARSRSKGAGAGERRDASIVTQYDMNGAREGRHAQDGLPRPHDAHGDPRRACR